MLIEKTETKWKEAGMAYFCIKNVWLNDASVILDWFSFESLWMINSHMSKSTFSEVWPNNFFLFCLIQDFNCSK